MSKNNNATVGRVIPSPKELKRIAARRDRILAAGERLRAHVNRLRRKAEVGIKLVKEYEPKPR